jgi:signal transduction histidine kinase
MLGGLVLIYEDKAIRYFITVNADMGEPIEFLCYEGEIRQVLNNLVGHAMDAMHDGGSLTIRVRSSRVWRNGGRCVRITIANDGVGMSAETKNKLFSPFFTTKGIDGTGLGLWIATDIVKKHEGRLQFRSKQTLPYRGTTFSLLLPLEAEGTHSDSASQVEVEART